jgi:hypothetical protein
MLLLITSCYQNLKGIIRLHINMITNSHGKCNFSIIYKWNELSLSSIHGILIIIYQSKYIICIYAAADLINNNYP